MTEEHKRAMQEAIETEAAAQQALLDGRDEEAVAGYRAAIAAWRRSWELAPPRSFGRLIGIVKAAVIAGEPEDAARLVRDAIDEPDSPPSWYATAIAALVLGDDALAARAAEGMRAGSEPFVRAAEAIDALAARDAARYGVAVRAIVEDFEQRPEHLTGVAIADTAVMLERLAERRDLAARPRSRVLPPPPG